VVKGKKEKYYSEMLINLASPDTILSWSHGEVLKPETVNYRSYKPEKDGLFCEKIFGPVKDYECHCGKYKRIRYKGIICDRCGVEVTTKAVRRERMGHITLAVPIVHIWYFRSVPSKIGYILDITTKGLEKIIYYENYVVIEAGNSGLERGDLLTEDEYFEVLESLGESVGAEESDEEVVSNPNPEETNGKFVAKMGGEAIRDLLSKVDIEELSTQLRLVVKEGKSKQKKKNALKRLKVIEAFRQTENGKTNLPLLSSGLEITSSSLSSWMLTVSPNSSNTSKYSSSVKRSPLSNPLLPGSITT